jgi:hypothetical protein
MVATRATTDDEFVASAPLLNVNSGSRELWGTVDRDELMLQFVSDRDPSNSQFYRATRASKAAPFGTPAPVDAPVGMFSPTTVDNGLGLYYAVLGEGIFYTSRSSTSDPFPAGTKLDGTPGGWVTFISADHCRAYFAVGLPGGPGSIDIHVSTRDPR